MIFFILFVVESALCFIFAKAGITNGINPYSWNGLRMALVLLFASGSQSYLVTKLCSINSFNNV